MKRRRNTRCNNVRNQWEYYHHWIHSGTKSVDPSRVIYSYKQLAKNDKLFGIGIGTFKFFTIQHNINHFSTRI